MSHSDGATTQAAAEIYSDGVAIEINCFRIVPGVAACKIGDALGAENIDSECRTSNYRVRHNFDCMCCGFSCSCFGCDRFDGNFDGQGEFGNLGGGYWYDNLAGCYCDNPIDILSYLDIIHFHTSHGNNYCFDHFDRNLHTDLHIGYSHPICIMHYVKLTLLIVF